MGEVFPNAPIVEAIIDFQVSFKVPPNFETLQTFATTLSEEFGEQTTTKQVSAGIKIDDSQPIGMNLETSDHGLVLRNKGNDKIIQLRMNGYSFSKLKPYSRWEDVRAEALQHWEAYREQVKPSKVTRMALRYINRIDLPLPFEDFREYILTNPEIAPGIPQAVANFFFKATVRDPDTGAWANIICTTAKQEDEKLVPYILDIDVFFQKEYELGSDDFYNDLETLREYKNNIFLSSVTEKTKEFFR